jgi:hypothetical protein
MQSCSDLVMHLSGGDASDGMFDMVFARSEGAAAPAATRAACLSCTHDISVCLSACRACAAAPPGGGGGDFGASHRQALEAGRCERLDRTQGCQCSQPKLVGRISLRCPCPLTLQSPAGEGWVRNMFASAGGAVLAPMFSRIRTPQRSSPSGSSVAKARTDACVASQVDARAVRWTSCCEGAARLGPNILLFLSNRTEPILFISFQ